MFQKLPGQQLQQQQEDADFVEKDYADKINRVYDEEQQQQQQHTDDFANEDQHNIEMIDKNKNQVIIPLDVDSYSSNSVQPETGIKNPKTRQNGQKNGYNSSSTHDDQEMSQEDYAPKLQKSPEIKQSKRKFRRYMGHTCGFLCLKGEPIITLGPHFGLFLITWLCMSAFSVFLIRRIAISKPFWVQYFTIILNTVQSLSYLLCAFKNPGIRSAKEGEEVNPQLINYCVKCGSNKDINTYHCPDCDVCIAEFDHHCPWTGKCIGGGNMFLFKIFIISTMIWFFYSMLLLIL